MFFGVFIVLLLLRKQLLLCWKFRVLLLSLVGDLFAQLRKRQPWADPKIVKVTLCSTSYMKLSLKLFWLKAFLVSLFLLQKLIDAKLYELLGERTAADDEKISKKKKEKNPKVEVR